MPAALLKQCTGPGCSNLTETSPCADCSKTRERWRGSRHERGYDAAWTRKSKHFLRQHPFCGMRPGGQAPVMSRCHDLGIVTPAKQTDHVVPHKGDRALFENLKENGQALCGACGARKSQAGL